MSFVASGAVAATIVAAHKITQQYSAGQSQGVGFQTALKHARNYLALSALMVQRNVILCSAKTVHTQNDGVKRVGCRNFGPISGDTAAVSFFDKLKLDAARNFSSAGEGTAPKKHSYKVILKDVKNRNSPFASLSRNDVGVKKGSIEWSLKNWKEDPAISTVVASIDSINRGFYKCRNTTTGEINEDGVCNPVHITETMQMLLDDSPRACKDSSDAPIADTACDYISTADNDGYTVFISVTYPYSDSGSETGASKLLQLKGVVRRPIARVTISGDNNPVCSMRCEGNGDGGIGLNTNPQCVGFSDYGVNDSSEEEDFDIRYDEGVLLAQNNFTVKNHGPGVLYYLKLKREDIDTENDRLLYQTMIKSSINSPVRPLDSIAVQDKLPCFIPSYYKVSVNRVNCQCSWRFARNAGVQRRPSGPTGICTSLNNGNTVAAPPVNAAFAGLPVNSATTRVLNCAGAWPVVVPRSCTVSGVSCAARTVNGVPVGGPVVSGTNFQIQVPNNSNNNITSPAGTSLCSGARLRSNGRCNSNNNQTVNIRPSFDMY